MSLAVTLTGVKKWFCRAETIDSLTSIIRALRTREILLNDLLGASNVWERQREALR